MLIELLDYLLSNPFFINWCALKVAYQFKNEEIDFFLSSRFFILCFLKNQKMIFHGSEFRRLIIFMSPLFSTTKFSNPNSLWLLAASSRLKEIGLLLGGQFLLCKSFWIRKSSINEFFLIIYFSHFKHIYQRILNEYHCYLRFIR